MLCECFYGRYRCKVCLHTRVHSIAIWPDLRNTREEVLKWFSAFLKVKYLGLYRRSDIRVVCNHQCLQRTHCIHSVYKLITMVWCVLSRSLNFRTVIVCHLESLFMLYCVEFSYPYCRCTSSYLALWNVCICRHYTTWQNVYMVTGSHTFHNFRPVPDSIVFANYTRVKIAVWLHHGVSMNNTHSLIRISLLIRVNAILTSVG